MASSTCYCHLNEMKRSENYSLINNLSILQITFVRQTVSHDYFRIMLSGKHSAEHTNETAINEISIKDEKGKYTLEFSNLLKEFYLNI